MANISAFRKEIQGDVPGCPPFLIDREVVKTIIRFCRKTNRLQEGFSVSVLSTDVDTTDNDSVEVDLSAISCMTDRIPIRVAHFVVDGTPYPAQEMKISTDLTYLESIVNTSIRYFTFPDSSTLKLFPFTAKAMEFFIRLAVQPSRTITSIDDVIYDEYLDAIEEGTKWRLFKMPGKVWSNKDDARECKREFLRLCEEAKIDVNRSFSHTDMIVEDNFF